MQILSNLLSADEISQMKQYWIDHENKKYVNWIQDDGLLIDHRLVIHNTPDVITPLSGIIDRIIETNHDPDLIEERWAALQRQTNPHGAHIDDFGKEKIERDPSLRMYTYIIALDTVPEFKAIVWKETAASNDAMIKMWPEFENRIRVSHLSEQEDLDHVGLVGNKDIPSGVNLGDILVLDGIFTYHAGSGCLFDGKQIHTTSYWKKYPKFTHRDLLQIHVLTHQHQAL